MNRRNYSIGILLIMTAIILFLGKMGVFSYLGVKLWPLLFLLIGAAFHVLFFSGLVPAAMLIPGGILVVYSLVFLACTIFSWDLMRYLWPGFIFGVAVGLYEVYFFDKQSSRGYVTAAMVLSIVSAVMFGLTLLSTMGIYLIIILLLIAGIFLIVRKPRSW